MIQSDQTIKSQYEIMNSELQFAWGIVLWGYGKLK